MRKIGLSMLIGAAAMLAQIDAPQAEEIYLKSHPLERLACQMAEEHRLREALIPPGMGGALVTDLDRVRLLRDDKIYTGAIIVVDTSGAPTRLDIILAPVGSYKNGQGGFVQFFRPGDGTPLVRVPC